MEVRVGYDKKWAEFCFAILGIAVFFALPVALACGLRTWEGRLFLSTGVVTALLSAAQLLLAWRHTGTICFSETGVSRHCPGCRPVCLTWEQCAEIGIIEAPFSLVKGETYIYYLLYFSDHPQQQNEIPKRWTFRKLYGFGTISVPFEDACWEGLLRFVPEERIKNRHLLWERAQRKKASTERDCDYYVNLHRYQYETEFVLKRESRYLLYFMGMVCMLGSLIMWSLPALAVFYFALGIVLFCRAASGKQYLCISEEAVSSRKRKLPWDACREAGAIWYCSKKGEAGGWFVALYFSSKPLGPGPFYSRRDLLKVAEIVVPYRKAILEEVKRFAPQIELQNPEVIETYDQYAVNAWRFRNPSN